MSPETTALINLPFSVQRYVRNAPDNIRLALTVCLRKKVGAKGPHLTIDDFQDCLAKCLEEMEGPGLNTAEVELCLTQYENKETVSVKEWLDGLRATHTEVPA